MLLLLLDCSSWPAVLARQLHSGGVAGQWQPAEPSALRHAVLESILVQAQKVAQLVSVHERAAPMAVVPTTLIIDFYDSYTRNLLVLFSQLASQHGWDPRWEQRVVVVNVDSLTWCVRRIEKAASSRCAGTSL